MQVTLNLIPFSFPFVAPKRSDNSDAMTENRNNKQYLLGPVNFFWHKSGQPIGTWQLFFRVTVILSTRDVPWKS